MLSTKQVNDFHEYGFVKGDVILNDEEVEILREELDLVLSGESVKKPILNRNLNHDPGSEFETKMVQSDTVVQILNMWMVSDAFFKHAGNQKICEDIAQLT